MKYKIKLSIQHSLKMLYVLKNFKIKYTLFIHGKNQSNKLYKINTDTIYFNITYTLHLYTQLK